MKRVKNISLCAGAGALFMLAPCAWAAEGAGAAAGGAPHGLDPLVLVGVALMLVVAKLGGELCERLRQPAVLGELVGGILLGNLALIGFGAIEPLKQNAIIAALAELGVIVLLFEVGLESSMGELLAVGRSALLVAAAGTCASFALGWGAAVYFLPAAPPLAHVFIGASLCATSIGITARVLRDLGRLQTREARIILGAAVVDDVLGLVILAVMAGLVAAAATGATLSKLAVLVIALKAAVFLVGAGVLGRYVVPQLFRGVGRFAVRGVLLAFAIAFCLLLAWTAARLGLAPIIGAFAAGLILDEVHFERLPQHEKRDLEELLAPVSALLVPLFFVLTGMRVDLRVLAGPRLLGFALALTLAALVGKQVCGLVVTERKINRLAIGIGMLPRGEVELIFAGVGATLMLPTADGTLAPVVDAATYGAIVVVVLITTLVAPPLLKWTLTRTTTTPEH
ncbi:MAG TPA: cation:proton antiporter [Pyrinomonadaceae bacterium]